MGYRHRTAGLGCPGSQQQVAVGRSLTGGQHWEGPGMLQRGLWLGWGRAASWGGAAAQQQLPMASQTLPASLPDLPLQVYDESPGAATFETHVSEMS